MAGYTVSCCRRTCKRSAGKNDHATGTVAITYYVSINRIFNSRENGRWRHFAGSSIQIIIKIIMLLIRRTREEIEHAIEIKSAHSWWTRLVGLLGTSTLHNHHAIWLKPCRSIHTIGMQYAIDVVFLDKEQVVRKLASTIQPFRICFAPR
ncbi:MAG TPA: hypothetical protein DCZ03_08200, partial [Gammaproteobacteria bacterium]|nr:hypothetical protein [Gammaproteobacteria bacterium]